MQKWGFERSTRADGGQSADPDGPPFVECDVQSFFSALWLYAHFIPLLSLLPASMLP